MNLEQEAIVARKHPVFQHKLAELVETANEWLQRKFPHARQSLIINTLLRVVSGIYAAVRTVALRPYVKLVMDILSTYLASFNKR